MSFREVIIQVITIIIIFKLIHKKNMIKTIGELTVVAMKVL